MSSNIPTVSIIVDHVKRDYGHEDGIEGWRQLPEIPAAGEILGPVNGFQDDSYGDDDDFDDSNNNRGPSLPFNVVDRTWRTKGEYIGAHYQLLREDAIAPLRQAVALFRSQPAMKDNQDLSIYTHVSRSFRSK
jgi:helicase required for RNAi-mediated heterochromatin assembly 1